MAYSDKDISKDAVIVNELGLHARSAAKIAEVARHAKSNVWIIKGSEKVDAKSIIDMLTLGCTKGSNITIKIDCQPDIEVLDRIVRLVESGFGE
ncbi:MAG: HPr family phosphocarrier protein [Desulfobacteraceae bacterium IS3]|nr:MAG: HPr family phosphocarrier protein [Desulfobacteraceae bacterium IS3]